MRAQHRRGRHRPGLQHGADADLRRGAAVPARSRARSPAPTPTARPTTGARPPAASPTSTGRSVVGAAAEVERQLKHHAARDARMRRRRPRTAARRPGRHQGRAGSRGELRRDLGARPLGRRRADHRHAQLGLRPEDGRSEARRRHRACRSRRSASSASARWSSRSRSTRRRGKVRVLRRLVGCDVGRAINPVLVEGQIEGAFVQGMGFALVEEMVWDGAAPRQPDA